MENLKITDFNVVTFDLETCVCPGQNGVKWTDYTAMGIACGGSYDSKTGTYRIFMQDNLEELSEQLNAADMVSGFNIIGFDIPLLNAVSKVKLRDDLIIYDILYHSRIATGWVPNGKFPSGLKLDDHLLGTFGKGGLKSGNGADAPGLFQEGKLGRLISYQLRDVQMEATLLRHIAAHGWVKTPTHGEKGITKPQTFLVKNEKD